MNLFWGIYTSGFIAALFIITCEFRKWCVRHMISPETALSDYNVILMILLDALGSWFAVLFSLFTSNKD